VARTSEHVSETLVPTNADNFLTGWEYISISSRTRYHGVSYLAAV